MDEELDAARLWGSAEEQERELGFRMLLNERRRYERWMSIAHDRLHEAFEAAHVAGARLTLEEAVSEALRRAPAAHPSSMRSAP